MILFLTKIDKNKNTLEIYILSGNYKQALMIVKLVYTTSYLIGIFKMFLLIFYQINSQT